MNTELQQVDDTKTESISKDKVHQEAIKQLTEGILPLNKILETLNNIYFLHTKSSYTFIDSTEKEKQDIDYTIYILNDVLLKLQSDK